MRTVSGLILFSMLCAGVVSAYADEADGNKEKDIPGIELGRMGDSARVDPDEFEFSRAESRLWLDNHLANIDKPGRLYYKFQKTGSYEQGFDDSIYLDILNINEDGTKDTNLEFFTGNRRQFASPGNLESVTGNPVLGLYMQGDVREMNRLTDGSWRYFQRRIKMAFAKDAEIKDITIDYNGGKVDAEKIVIKPYLNDPHRRQFERFAEKVYEFILSNKIPGSIYQIKTVVPDAAHPDGEPLIVEKLTSSRRISRADNLRDRPDGGEPPSGLYFTACPASAHARGQIFHPVRHRRDHRHSAAPRFRNS